MKPRCQANNCILKERCKWFITQNTLNALQSELELKTNFCFCENFIPLNHSKQCENFNPLNHRKQMV